MRRLVSKQNNNLLTTHFWTVEIGYTKDQIMDLASSSAFTRTNVYEKKGSMGSWFAIRMTFKLLQYSWSGVMTAGLEHQGSVKRKEAILSP